MSESCFSSLVHISLVTLLTRTATGTFLTFWQSYLIEEL